MRNHFLRLLALALALCALCGCGLIETDTPPTLPKLDLSGSTLTGTVEYVNGRTCRILVTQGDSHYNAATEKREADAIFVTFSTLEGSKSVQVGDTITFTYSYTDDVSERNSEPHITVNRITVRSAQSAQ